jgi:ribonuclease P protein component
VENSKIYSLKKSSDFLFLSKNGKKIKLATWLTIQYLSSESLDTYVGITASKKVGPAVVRNKLKRWVKNSARENFFLNQFSGKKIVFVFRAQAGDFYKDLTFKEFKLTLQQARIV